MAAYKFSLEMNDGKPSIVKEKEYPYDSVLVCSSEDCVDAIRLMERPQNRCEEFVYLMCFNTKMQLIGISEVSHGGASFCFVSPREALMRALLCGATYVILIHNHPSGDPSPSEADGELTKNMYEACKLIGIPLRDHVIIAGDMYYSYSDSGAI